MMTQKQIKICQRLGLNCDWIIQNYSYKPGENILYTFLNQMLLPKEAWSILGDIIKRHKDKFLTCSETYNKIYKKYYPKLLKDYLIINGTKVKIVYDIKELDSVTMGYVSFNDKIIWLSPILLVMPKDFIDSVIAHELSHFERLTRDDDKIMQNYRDYDGKNKNKAYKHEEYWADRGIKKMLPIVNDKYNNFLARKKALIISGLINIFAGRSKEAGIWSTPSIIGDMLIGFSDDYDEDFWLVSESVNDSLRDYIYNDDIKGFNKLAAKYFPNVIKKYLGKDYITLMIKGQKIDIPIIYDFNYKSFGHMARFEYNISWQDNNPKKYTVKPYHIKIFPTVLIWPKYELDANIAHELAHAKRFLEGRAKNTSSDNKNSIHEEFWADREMKKMLPILNDKYKDKNLRYNAILIRNRAIGKEGRRKAAGRFSPLGLTYDKLMPFSN